MAAEAAKTSTKTWIGSFASGLIISQTLGGSPVNAESLNSASVDAANSTPKDYYLTESIYGNGNVLSGSVSCNVVTDIAGNVPNATSAIPAGYETWIKNNPTYRPFDVPVDYNPIDNTFTTPEPSFGLIDGLLNLIGVNINFGRPW